MRKLKTMDLFSLMKVLKKMNMKEEIKELTLKANKKSKKESIENVQAELVVMFIEHIPDAQVEICEFLGDLSGKTEKEIEEQPPIDTINQIKELFGQENFGNFLSNALK